VQPLIIVTLNSGVIPVLVDLIADLENHKTKSSRQVAIMRKNFIFQIINTIFLQITLSSSIKTLIDQLEEADITIDSVKMILLKGFFSP
jgi:hypothetical protein